MKRPGPEAWKELIEAFPASGLSQKEYVAKHEVALSSFQYWLYKREKLKSKFDVKSRDAFLPVHVVASAALKAREAVALEAELRSGVVLRFAVGTDTRYVAELVAALG